HYGNCIGVANVGGDAAFDPAYDHNILVNAFTLGIAPADRIFRAKAAGPGNPVIYVGSRTGRDGIHGASLLASASLDALAEEIRLSEAQERMLIGAKQGSEDAVRAIFERWDLQAVVIGTLTDDGVWRARWHGEDVAAIPAAILTDAAPVYKRPAEEPARFDE